MTTEEISAIQDAITALDDFAKTHGRSILSSPPCDDELMSWVRIGQHHGTAYYATEMREKLERILKAQ